MQPDRGTNGFLKSIRNKLEISVILGEDSSHQVLERKPLKTGIELESFSQHSYMLPLFKETGQRAKN